MDSSQRSPLLMAIGILNVIGGTLGLYADVDGIGAEAAGAPLLVAKKLVPVPPIGPEPNWNWVEEQIRHDVSHFSAYLSAQQVCDSILCLLMIAGGLGILASKAWGRSLSLLYATSSIAIRLLTIAYGFCFIAPVITRYFSGPGPVAPAIVVLVPLSPLLSLISMGYPLGVVVVLLRSSVDPAVARS